MSDETNETLGYDKSNDGAQRSGEPLSTTEKKPEKRKTVTVTCAHPNGIQLRLHRKAGDDGMPAMPDPDHDPVVLQAGSNAGIDKEFFDRWLEQNKDLAENLSISAVDEKDPETESAKREE